MKLTKEISGKIADLDTKKGLVKAYFNAFGNIDSDNDMIKRGAHAKTIKERGPGGTGRIKHFKQHDSWQVPGVIKEMGEDSFGGYFVSQLAPTVLGKDTLIEYEMGIITEHSFGFEIIKSEHIEDMEIGNYQLITETKIWEVSSLTAWGANANTPTVSVKSDKEVFEQIEKILKQGNLSDETLEKAEQLYKTLRAVVKHSEPEDILLRINNFKF